MLRRILRRIERRGEITLQDGTDSWASVLLTVGPPLTVTHLV